MATQEQEVSSGNLATLDPSVAKIDMKFEIVVIPVSDIDRAKEFYTKLGWRLDADYDNGSDFRVIQFTPPGSGCSVIFGRNVTAAAPGSAQGLYLIVSDVAAARNALIASRRRRERSLPQCRRLLWPRRTLLIRPHPRQWPRSRTWQLSLLRLVPRSRWQRLAISRDHRASARSHRLYRDFLRFSNRPGIRSSTRSGSPRRTRKAQRRPARRELARLVRRLYGGRAGRDEAAGLKDHGAAGNSAGAPQPSEKTVERREEHLHEMRESEVWL